MKPSDDREFMATLAKGLAVLGSFGERRPAMTLSEAAAVTGLSRAAARRVLLDAAAAWLCHRRWAKVRTGTPHP